MKKIFIVIAILNSFNISFSTTGVTLLGTANFRDGAPGADASVLRLTYTISKPGIYKLTEDIQANTSVNRTIWINSDNVTLDLNGFPLSQPALSGNNVGADVHAIEVADGKKNVLIENGTIFQIEGSGIKANNTVTNLTIRNITFNNCNRGNSTTAGTITLTGANGSSNEILHCRIENCHIQDMSCTEDAAGIYATNADYLTIDNCTIKGISTTTDAKSGYGVYITESEYPIIKDSSAQLVTGNDLAAGFGVITCTGAQLTNCKSMGVVADNGAETVGDAYAFYFENTHNSTIADCTAANTVAKVEASGFYQTSCRNNHLLNCVASASRVTHASNATNATGFYTNTESAANGPTDSCYFKNCVAFGHMANENIGSKAAGFMLDDTTRFCILEGCLAFGNVGAAGGQGVGIHLAHNNNLRNVIINCQTHCQSSHVSDKAYGIYDQGTTPDNAFFRNLTFVNTDQADAAGDNNNFISTQIAGASGYANVFIDGDINTLNGMIADAANYTLGIQAKTT